MMTQKSSGARTKADEATAAHAAACEAAPSHVLACAIWEAPRPR